MTAGPEGRWHPPGYSLPELLIVLALIGLICAIGASTYVTAQKRANCTTAARMVKTFMLQTRMLAVYKGINHFVVLDPATNQISIFADTNVPVGVYDAGDSRIAGEWLPVAARLALPAAPSPLASPLGTGNVANAWSLPLPDSGTGAWGSNLRGLRMTPTGQIQSAESPPQTVVSGEIVFSDVEGNTTCVGVRGQSGNVRTFQLLNSAWSEM